MMASAGSSDPEQKMNSAAADPPAAANTAVDAAENKQEAGSKVDAGKNKQEGGSKKKRREMMMPQREVDFVLSYEPEICAPATAAWLKALDPDLYALEEELDRRMLAKQEDFKRQIASKGYVSIMVEVHDDDEEEYEEDNEDEDCFLDHETLEEPRDD